MKAKKILFVTQEITPYVPESQMSITGRQIPQRIQEQGFEIRTFMPRWGNINERRNQLHEVIRLSGMNIIIDETDHPLIIKVASIQAARMQVYFIDNDDFFHKRQMITDEAGQEYADNAERAIFYARGVLETVKKLRWVPDVIHCHGWISAIVPLYVKTAFREDPTFADTKVVFSGYDEMLTLPPADNIKACIAFRDATKKVLDKTGIDFTRPESIGELAVYFSDGFVQAGKPNSLNDFATAKGIPTLQATTTEDLSADDYATFYHQIFDSTDE